MSPGFDSQGLFRSWRGVAHPRSVGEPSTLKSLLFVASLSNPRRKWAGKAPGILPGERTLRAHKPHRAAPTTAPPPLSGVSSLLRGAIPGLLGFNSSDNSLLTKLGSHPGISRALQEGRGNERQGCAQGLGLFQQTAPGAGRGSLEMLPALCWLLQRSGIAPPRPQIAHSGSFSQLLWWLLGQTTSGGPRGHPQSAILIRDKGFCTLGRQKTHQPLPTTGTELNLGSFPHQRRKTGTKLREKWPKPPLRARTPRDPTANPTQTPQREQHPCGCERATFPIPGELCPAAWAQQAGK